MSDQLPRERPATPALNAAPRLPWSAPSVRRIPVAAHTKGVPGFAIDSSPFFDDIGAAS